MLVHVTTLIFVLGFFFFFFVVAYFLRKFTLYYFIFSVSLCQSECRLKSKPHDGDRGKKKKRVKVWSGYLWNPAGLFIVIVSCTWPQEGKKTTQRSSCHVKKKKTGMQEISEPSRVFLSSNIPVGYQMMWDEFCNNCSVGNSGQMSLELKGKQSLFFFNF